MGCSCTGNSWDAWLACGGVTPQPLVADSVLMNFAAQAGATSSVGMCPVVAMLKARRIAYWKVQPGDCGTNAFLLGSSSTSAALGARVAATADPEPISKTILTGLATIFGGFGAAHAAAVQTEETTICKVAASYNQLASALEQAVLQGAMTPDQAVSTHSQAVSQLDSFLAAIAKQCNASCIYRMALRALDAYVSQVVYPTLAATLSSNPIAAITTPPVSSPGAPGTYTTNPPTGSSYPNPSGYPSSPSNYAGVSGFTPTPMNANNPGVGPTTVASSLPGNLPVGAIVIIGGIAFIASKPGAVAGA